MTSSMRRSAWIGCFLFFSLASMSGWGAEPGLTFRRIAIPDDVPAHLCSALAQDRDGFLWIGTQGGLVRFDGYRFRTWTSDPSNRSTIGGSYVRALLAARDGTIWIGFFRRGTLVARPGRGGP